MGQADIVEEEDLLELEGEDRVKFHYQNFEFDPEDEELIVYFDQELNESESRPVHSNFFLLHWSELAKRSEAYEKEGLSEWSKRSEA